MNKNLIKNIFLIIGFILFLILNVIIYCKGQKKIISTYLYMDLVSFKSSNALPRAIIILSILLIILFFVHIEIRKTDKKLLSKNYEELNALYEELNASNEELTATEEELRTQYYELNKSEESLRVSEERYKLAIEATNDAIWEWDIEKNIFFASDKWNDLTEYTFSKRDSFKNILQKLSPSKSQKILLNNLNDHLGGKTPFYQCEFKLKTKSGKEKWLFIRAKALINEEGKAIKMAGSITDITNRKIIEKKTEFLAYYDSLTALPNRAMVINELNKFLKDSDESDKKGAVIFVDLDNFKKVNDTLGHEYGDKLLQRVANTLKIAAAENTIVSRLGGDEFLILKHAINNENDVIKVCKRIISAFENPFEINEQKIFTSVSIGISIYPRNGISTNSLLKNADTAMYKAKDLGKNRYELYNNRMSYEVLRKTELEEGLRNAIENNELNLYYQPQIDCKTGKIKAMEALLRWKNTENGFVSPVEFIPIAEDSSLIIPIGQWVLKTACKQTKLWLDKGYDFGTIAVNVSVVQLQHPGFLEMVKSTLIESKLPAELLQIEITESVFMESVQANIAALEKLKKLGVSIALDDFGTGYSSLSYLRLLPISVLKIDKSFIDRIHFNSKDCSILEGIIHLSHNMNISVVAEGVELEEQLEILNSMNCGIVQGHLFSKPMPAEIIENMAYPLNSTNYQCKKITGQLVSKSFV